VTAELLPPDEMSLEAAGVALAAALAVEDSEVRERDRTFYDTFDGLLHAEGLTLSHEDGQLVLLDTASGVVRAVLPWPPPTGPFSPTTLNPGPLRDALTEVCGVRALLALVHVHCRVRGLRVLDDERKTVVRLKLEEPALIAAGSADTSLRPRVRLAAVRGYDKELAQVTDRLQDELAFKPSDQSLVDEAVRAAGGVPGGISSKIHVALRHGQRADESAASVLRRLLEVIEANVDGSLADIDTEFLHDFRVSVRRSRAVQRELKGVFPPEELARFRGEFKWLQQVTGDARDLDVYVLEFDEYAAMVGEAIRSDLDPLRGVLRTRRDAAHRDMNAALRSRRTQELLSGWSLFLERLASLSADERADAPRPIEAVAGERIRKVYGRMVKMGRAIDESSPGEDYHELRKMGKELRYLLELFGAPLYPEQVVKPMIKTLKSLQDVLGRHQDREVQVQMLRSLRDEVAGLPEGAAALMATGVLVERLAEDEQAARRAFAERFAAFASKSQRQLVRETFA
jgi:CHAD domain-containing protein